MGTRLKGCNARWLGLPISGSRSWNVYGASLCVSTSRTMFAKLLRVKLYRIKSDIMGLPRGTRLPGQLPGLLLDDIYGMVRSAVPLSYFTKPDKIRTARH